MCTGTFSAGGGIGEYAGDAKAELGAAELGTADFGTPELGAAELEMAEFGVADLGAGEMAALTLLKDSKNTHLSPPADLGSLSGTWREPLFSDVESNRGNAPPGCAVWGTCGGSGERGGCLGW